MRRAALAALLVLAAAGPACADPTPGTYRSTGTHSALGAFTGELTLARAQDGSWDLRGRYTLTGGRPLSWTGRGAVAGGRLEVRVTYSTGGFLGVLGGLTATREARGSYELAPDGRLVKGGWRATSWPRHRVREALTLGGGAPTSVNVDLQAFVRGKAVSGDVVVAMNLDDDDGDGGRGGDGEVEVERDFDDDDGTPGEDDLVELRAAAPAGAALRFAHGSALAVYRGKDRTGRVAPGQTAAPGTFWLEGRAATTPGAGEALAVEVVDGGQVAGRDELTVHVARSAFLLVGHGCTGTWYVRDRSQARAIDARRDPALVKGKGGAYWAIHVGETEKEAKVALSTPDAVIAYDGHSNFGMGFAFDTGFSRLSQFMNIADPQIPVNWPYLREHQDHPSLLFAESEYGDDAATGAAFDPVATTVVVDTSRGPLRKTRWPVSGGGGTRFSLVRGAQRWHDHHYGDGEGERIVVKAGARDMPAKRWAKLFLNSCYSGSYYVDSFGGHGTLFMTTDESSASQTSGAFIFGFVDGKSNDEVLADLNGYEDINAYREFGAPQP